jgi:2-polyprenyl-3-methyl-5-hydroxy-6-metoxy-1,4-benzoquinol methylase
MGEESDMRCQPDLMPVHPYNKHYYDSYHTEAGPVPYVREQGPWLLLFRAMAEFIDITIKPKKVLDAGCAKGFLVESLRDRGIDAFGIDVSEYAVGEVRPDIRAYCRVSSLITPLSERYDLITCIEVLEHMTEEEGRRAIANICKSTNDVLFSSTPDDFDEPTHVNVRPRTYWVQRFAEAGFSLDAGFDARAIAPHAMRFCKVTPEAPAVDALLDLRDFLRRDIESLNQTVKATVAQVASLQSRLYSMEHSTGWRALERIKRMRDRMVPPNTLRSGCYAALCQGAKAILDSGFRAGLRQSLVSVYRAFASRNKKESDTDAAAETGQSSVVFNEHALAHVLLDGLTGLEIGPAAQNPFGLCTRTVELMESQEFYASIQQDVMGLTPPKVDIWASADCIPVLDQSEDFILSSHVIEHLPNVIAAFVEWNRIVKDGGYVFMIVPLPWALPADRDRELTTLEHFINDYHQRLTLETHPVEGIPGGKMGHYHTFVPSSLLQIVYWMRQSKLCEWELAAREDVDSKVGNGFTLAFKVRHGRTENSAPGT